MLICEIFYSLQGEGTYIGAPSIFIRTSGCTQKCCWCDTPYTSWWNEGNKVSIDEIYKTCINHSGYVKHIVITGGEPMIQKDLPELVNLLKKNKHFVTIETNGTIFNPDVKPDLFSISPKTSNSIPDKDNHPKDITDWKDH
jgi:7-carboxy-7-deazaguanine synthase